MRLALLRNHPDFELAYRYTTVRAIQVCVKALARSQLKQFLSFVERPDSCERCFQMIDENKLNEMRGDQLRKIVQNGMLPLIYAHLFSLSQMREIFARQMAQGKMPAPNLVS